MAFNPSAESFRLGLAAVVPFWAAQRALCAAAIRARPAALMVRFPGAAALLVPLDVPFGRPDRAGRASP